MCTRSHARRLRRAGSSSTSTTAKSRPATSARSFGRTHGQVRSEVRTRVGVGPLLRARRAAAAGRVVASASDATSRRASPCRVACASRRASLRLLLLGEGWCEVKASRQLTLSGSAALACEHCWAPLPAWAPSSNVTRQDRRFCSGTCRTAAHRLLHSKWSPDRYAYGLRCRESLRRRRCNDYAAASVASSEPLHPAGGNGSCTSAIVAALFVDPAGAYAAVPGVDLWPESRDARLYQGPHPVVAHPPCNRWCMPLAKMNETRYGHRVGDDGGCFASALAAVRAWGGVLEHPSGSAAWREFSLKRPKQGAAWIEHADGEWVCDVAQSAYGHPAIKRTWLFYAGARPPAPMLTCVGEPTHVCSFLHDRTSTALPRLRGRAALQTPPAFRDALLQLARASRSAVALTPAKAGARGRAPAIAEHAEPRGRTRTTGTAPQQHEGARARSRAKAIASPDGGRKQHPQKPTRTRKQASP